MKTVEKIVEQLRSEGVLDEKALALFNKKSKRTKLFAQILTAILLLVGIISFSFITLFFTLGILYCGYSIIYLPEVKRRKRLLELYTFGKLVGTNIEIFEHVNRSLYNPFGCKIKYSFKDDSGLIECQKIFNPIHDYPSQKLNKESTIKILYDTSNPQNNWIFDPELKKEFCLKMKRD